MNQEIQKQIVMRLVGVSALAAVGWHFAVGPQVGKARDAESSYELQLEEVAMGEDIVNQFELRMDSAASQMETIRSNFAVQFCVGQDANIHTKLQDSAESFGLTVSRIEPLQKTIDKHVNEQDESEVHLETQEYRIECSGSYGGVVKYLQSLSQMEQVAKVGTFRIIPGLGQEVRVIFEVAIYRLTHLPDSFSQTVGGGSSGLNSGGEEYDG